MFNRSSDAYNILSGWDIHLCNSKKLSAITRRNYISDIRYFIDWQLTRPENLLTHPHTPQAFLEYLVACRLPKSSINRKISSLRAFYQFCLIQGLIEANYARSISTSSIEASELKTIYSKLDFTDNQTSDLEDFISFSNNQI